MGIHGLTKLIADKAPGAIKEHKMDSYFGRKIAVDASMSIYQFLIAVRQGEQGQLTNEAGEVTSHITGMLYRTIRMMEAGIKPAFVFDGRNILNHAELRSIGFIVYAIGKPLDPFLNPDSH